MRRGALPMVFDRVKLPDGTVQPARFELCSIESDSAKTDSEGTVHPIVRKKRLALQLGGTSRGGKRLPIFRRRRWPLLRAAHAGTDWRLARRSSSCKRVAG